MPDIKNIIFDFGGVIYDIDHRKVEDAFKKLGLDNFKTLFSKASQTDLFSRFETGRISPGQFRDEFRKITGLNIGDNKIDETWNQILCDYQPYRIELLNKIKYNYRLFLLSNTNQIHYDFYIPQFEKSYGYSFFELFEDTFWTFKIGVRKPDPDPFLHILDKLCIEPGETLFIDDSIQNVEAARKLNILAIHLNDETDMTDLFESGKLRKDLRLS